MKTPLDCIPCFYIQCLGALRHVDIAEEKKKQVLDELGREIQHFSLDEPPPRMGRTLHRLVKQQCPNGDPYAELKRQYLGQALELQQELKRMVREAGDPLLAAATLATIGNVIDFGAQQRAVDPQREIRTLYKQDLAICDYDQLRRGIANARTILYIADNSAEVVFDRLLLEQLKGKSIIFAVRGAPIINDATRDDALAAEIDQLATVITTGDDAPGILFDSCSSEFLDAYRHADLVIAKGQGNFETLNDETRPLCFLLMAKCAVLARHLDVPRNSLILKCQGM
jgi:uncharacterized protein with ATP-grasp and redox domains